jgi:hypothetical protein
VDLLDGALSLSADPGALRYPGGTADEEVGVIELRIEELPPSEREPWIGREEQSFAFLFTPISLQADAPITLRFTPPNPLMPGAVYRIWTVDKVLAELIDSGTATVGVGGDIATESDANLDRVGMLFLVPEPTGG